MRVATLAPPPLRRRTPPRPSAALSADRAQPRPHTTAQPPATIRHEPALDGLRGLAVALVVIYHFEPGWLPGGFLGVDVFMVVSGFLITRLLLAEWQRDGGIGLRAFWIRRARRLLPALGLLLLGVAAVSAAWLPRSQLSALRGDAIAALAYVANWHLIATGQSYVSAAGTPSPLRHTWSLAIEEQYYVLWPLVVLGCLALRRWGRTLLGVICGLGVALSAWAMAAAHRPDSPDRAYYGTDARAQTLLIGAGLAVLVHSRALRRPRTAGTEDGTSAVRPWLAGAACMAVLVQAWLWRTATVGDAWLYHGGFTLFALLTALVVLAALRPGLVARSLSWRPFTALGLVSYGIYLWHWPVFVFLTPVRVGVDGLALLAVRVAVTLALTLVSYRLIEQPVRRRQWSDRFVSRVLAPAGLAAVVAAFLLVSTLSVPLPRYLRTNNTATAGAPEVVRAVSKAPAVSPRPLRAAPGLRREPTTPAVLPTVAVVQGDSVAASLEDALAIELAQRGVTTVKSAVNGCGMIAGSPLDPDGRPYPFGPSCSEQIVSRQQHDIATYQPGVVVWISSWEARDREVDGKRIRLGTDQGDRAELLLMQAAADRLTAKGARIAVVTLPVPYDTAEVTHPEGLAAAIPRMNRLLRQLARDDERVDLIDLARIVCGPGHQSLAACPHERDGIELRADGLHYGDAGAAWVAPRLADVLLDPDRWRTEPGT